ncbi:hypothetical protein [Streptomyces violascens]|uniref:Uncharacterized protein n=1 Tax=Streptomyces violascens TaxID=67381 RepID=A0ABQ3QWK2_9ACTN|nr:hypothetical protein [Streptomyces violascens]GHI41649.1 hypothetical protein Sviol_60570 [Streptomyces violascens]
MRLELVLEVTDAPDGAGDILLDRLAAADVDAIEPVTSTLERTGFAEPVTIVATAVVVVGAGGQLIQQLRQLLQELDGLRNDWAKLRAVRVRTPSREHDAGNVTAEELAAEDAEQAE